jgi:hypothetical protein
MTDMTENNSGRVFTIITLKSVIIKSLFETIKPYIKECNMMITPEFIKISTLDIAKESVTYVKLNANKLKKPKFKPFHFLIESVLNSVRYDLMIIRVL